MKSQAGMTLIELMVVVLIIGILAGIAYPAYTDSMTRTHRRAATACLSSFATHMERFYTTNLRYDQDTAGTAMNTAALQALNLDCASAANTGQHYTYSFNAIARATYTLNATPTGQQATRDAKCGTLRLDQTGTRSVTGTAGVSNCW